MNVTTNELEKIIIAKCYRNVRYEVEQIQTNNGETYHNCVIVAHIRAVDNVPPRAEIDFSCKDGRLVAVFIDEIVKVKIDGEIYNKV